ncbi:B3 domain-containing protein Os01g0723500-like [Triticum urartu]|uniref:B3 domain-containing protein Os01g0723500-like n=1 Tax=Triticum urartu TaxID=4572 RepID=UPI0020430DCD|nr:B3 domain-containing protein Os01g0723500-like [Triticum urartu]
MPDAERQSPLASAERRPHFFKVLIGDFKKRLKIPPKFCKHIPWEASRKAKGLKEASMAATLEGPSGRTWQVVIRRTAEGTFFTAGWAKFVQDQALRELEFLVFRHDGGTSFAAMVFDKSACEREDLLLAGDAPRPRRKRGRPRTASRALDESTGMELVPYRAPADRPPQAACSDRMPESDKSNGSAGHPGPMKAEVGAGELPLCLIAAPPSASGQLPPGHLPAGTKDGCAVKTRSIHGDLAAASIPPSVRKYNGYVSRRRPVASAERQRAMELARAFRSSLPYCVIRMSTMHVYYSFMMRFPTGFSRQHLPREKTEMVLRDPGGKAWAALYIPSTRDRLSRGWCAFARGNCLEEGDCCVFELVGAAEFRVHVFRVVEPAVPAVRLRLA